MSARIPKRIIQIWGGHLDLPPLSRAAAANLKLLNPGFEYLLFDDAGMAGFVKEHFPEYQSVLQAFRFPIQRYDFFRYLAVYRLGGFYFDTDVLLSSPLSPLLDSSCVFSFEALTTNTYLRDAHGMDWEVGNYAFGAGAGNPFILRVIENCVRALKDPDWTLPMMQAIPRVFRGDFFVLYTTGPGLVSRTLAEYPDAANEVEVLFPQNVCDRSNWGLFGEYGVHVMQGQWRQRDSFVRRRLLVAWQSWRTRRLFAQSAKLGGSRSLAFRPAT